MTKKEIYLPASCVAVGHCVNMFDIESPSGKYIAVVETVRPNKVVARYLYAGIDMEHCWTGNPKLITPISHFGVRVCVCNGEFWCEPDGMLQKIAFYPDGLPRPWQEHNGPVRLKPKKLALRLAMRQLKKEKAECQLGTT